MWPHFRYLVFIFLIYHNDHIIYHPLHTCYCMSWQDHLKPRPWSKPPHWLYRHVWVDQAWCNPYSHDHVWLPCIMWPYPCIMWSVIIILFNSTMLNTYNYGIMSIIPLLHCYDWQMIVPQHFELKQDMGNTHTEDSRCWGEQEEEDCNYVYYFVMHVVWMYRLYRWVVGWVSMFILLAPDVFYSLGVWPHHSGTGSLPSPEYCCRAQ